MSAKIFGYRFKSTLFGKQVLQVKVQTFSLNTIPNRYYRNAAREEAEALLRKAEVHND